GYFVQMSEGGEVKKMPKGLIFGLIAAVIVIAGIGGYFFVQKQKADQQRQVAEQQAMEQLQKQKELEQQKQTEIEAMKKQMQEQLAKMMEEAEKEADQRAKEELMRRAKAEQERQMEEIRKAEEQRKKIENERKKQEDLLAKQRAEEERKAQEAEEQKKKAEEEKKRLAELELQKKLEAEKQKEQEKKSLRGQLVGLSEVDVEPKLIYQEKPKINAGWRAKGTFTLTALIDENGNTEDVKVIKGLQTVTRGAKLAERAVIDSVRKWKYTPALKEGVAVKVWITVRISI
nr:TonB family protein [Synergistaceae bacterium]